MGRLDVIIKRLKASGLFRLHADPGIFTDVDVLPCVDDAHPGR